MMMAAMMLPALAPTVSLQMAFIRQQTSHSLPLLIRIMAFLLGYLLIWGIFGIPVFVLCLAIDHFMRSIPFIAIGVGILVFIIAGFYQFTPQKKQALLHCNSAIAYQKECYVPTSIPSIHAQLKDGLQHGATCLQCCGLLMIVLVAVGLMNLSWMVLMMIAIFLEKVWVHGYKFSVLLGFGLISYGLFAFIAPSLLPGLYIP